MAESFDLLTQALSMRARETRLPGSWEHGHARLMLSMRVLIGIWLVILTMILYGYHRATTPARHHEQTESQNGSHTPA